MNVRVAVGASLTLFLLGSALAGCDAERARASQGAAQSAPAQGGQPPASRPALPQMIPWLEVNTDERASLDRAVEGLLIWRRVTDTAIISTAPGYAKIYGPLRQRTGNMRIIPGLKTAELLKKFDDPAAWRLVADEVRAMCLAANERRIVFENETALCNEENPTNNYWDGVVEFDFDKLKRGMAMLPPDVEVWWYPSFVTGGAPRREKRHERSARLCRAVAEVLMARFVVSEVGMPPERNEWWNADLARLRDEISKRPSIPIVYFWGDNKFWRDDDFLVAMRSVRGKDAIVYPGAKRWVPAARRFVDMIEQDRAEKP